MFQLFIELVKKDLLIFLSDRKAMMITLAVPIVIASFLAPVMGGASNGDLPNKVPVLVVDQDGSATTKAMVEKLKASTALDVKESSLENAQKQTLEGNASVALVMPKEFGKLSADAMAGGPPPTLQLLIDPSKNLDTQVAKGNIIQALTGVLAKNLYNRDEVLPFKFSETKQSNSDSAKWSGSAHIFAGMGVQALFFGALEAAMLMMRDRRNGIWSRLRASPVSRWTLLIARLCGATIQSSIVYCTVFAVGMAIFKFRITGSVLGFFLVAVSLAAMVASTGLLIAALGKTEQQSRGLSILVILSMLLLGGAWIPSFLMPSWIQPVSIMTPVRWAIDGVDAMTWRGEGLSHALPSVGVLLLFTAVFTLIAGSRFRWEPEAR